MGPKGPVFSAAEGVITSRCATRSLDLQKTGPKGPVSSAAEGVITSRCAPRSLVRNLTLWSVKHEYTCNDNYESKVFNRSLESLPKQKVGCCRLEHC